MTEREWQKKLDKLHRDLNWAEASLREAEREGRAAQAERAREQMDELNRAIRDHHEKRP